MYVFSNNCFYCINLATSNYGGTCGIRCSTVFCVIVSIHAGVENVVNFDFPPTVDSYIHRVGRYTHTYTYTIITHTHTIYHVPLSVAYSSHLEIKNNVFFYMHTIQS